MAQNFMYFVTPDTRSQHREKIVFEPTLVHTHIYVYVGSKTIFSPVDLREAPLTALRK